LLYRCRVLTNKRLLMYQQALYRAKDMTMKENSIVVLRFGQTPGIINREETDIVQTPMECFSRAVLGKTQFIVVILSGRNISARSLVFELCRCLKKNPLTKEIPVIVLMDSIHREILVKFHESGVTLFKNYKSGSCIDLNQIKDLIGGRDQAVNLRGLLKKICPALNYIKIDDRYELIVCGAYMNRMALGGIRLHEVCETHNHLNCEYFVSPRMAL